MDHTHTRLAHDTHTYTHTHVHECIQSSSERDRGGPSSYCNAEVSIPLHYRTVRESSRVPRFRERAPRHGTVGTYTAVTRACPLSPSLSPVFPPRNIYTYYIFLHCPEQERRRARAVAERERPVPRRRSLSETKAHVREERGWEEGGIFLWDTTKY